MTPTLLATTKTEPRKIIGTVSAAEFIVAVCASLGFLINIRQLDIEWRLRAGVDYSRDIVITLRHAIGDCIVLRDAAGALEGFALFHDAPLVEGRSREEIRVLKCVLAEEAMMARMAEALAAQARRSGALRCAIRLQGEYAVAFRTLVARGARVRWSDLRMALSGFEERVLAHGLVLSNWEI